MRVLILAPSSQKAEIADKLIYHRDLSKILISIASSKLVTQAQSLIVYFETKEDLKKLGKLLKIYQGVPLKFYYGPKNFGNFSNYYHFDDTAALITAIFDEHKSLGTAAEEIYAQVLKGEDVDKLTVEHLLRGLDESSRDVIEEQCVALFQTKKDQKDPKKVLVGSKKFKQWWSEGKLEDTEQIKFYLIDWIVQQVKEKSLDIGMIQKYQSYSDKKKEIKILNEHYENNFTL